MVERAVEGGYVCVHQSMLYQAVTSIVHTSKIDHIYLTKHVGGLQWHIGGIQTLMNTLIGSDFIRFKHASLNLVIQTNA